MKTKRRSQAVKVFISYAHDDETLRDKLEKHLSILKRNGVISTWHDRKIGLGREWAGAISEEIESSQVILLLISSSFVASDYCYDIEMNRALQRHNQGNAIIIPIILRPVDWEGAPFSKLQALPLNAKPVTKWKNRDEAFEDIAKGINNAVKRLLDSADRSAGEKVLKVQIFLQGRLSSLTPERSSAIIDALSGLLQTPSNTIEVYRVYDGSIIFELGIPYSASRRLQFLLTNNDAGIHLLKIDKVLIWMDSSEREEWKLEKGKFVLVSEGTPDLIDALHHTNYKESKSLTVSLASDAVRSRFVGRQDALDEFYQRFAYIHMQNGVYYWGGGGTGKTWILQKIYLDNLDDPTREATRIIDFFDTRNQSIRGLQTSIRERLDVLGIPEIFAPYEAIIAQLEAARLDLQTRQGGLLASLENRANKVFIECCQQALRDRKVILLLDTFERVQQRDVGQWLLHEFLVQVTGLIVAIAGRPTPPTSPSPAKVPDNFVSYKLTGLAIADVQEYVNKSWPQLSVPESIIRSIYEVAEGNPLLLDLTFDLASAEYIRNLNEITELPDIEKLKRDLIQRHFSAASELNRVIWAMAYLKRRFDVPMLKFIVDNGDLLDLSLGRFTEIVGRLGVFKFVKEYPEQQNHLLHDEMQVIITQYLLEQVDPRWDFRGKLYELIALKYYSKLISDAETKGNYVLSKQLKTEQFGYIFERSLRGKNPDEGLRYYQTYRDQVEISHDYDFEELLWGEVRDQLPAADGYEISYKRGQWLRDHGLFSKAEDNFNQMLRRYPMQEASISKPLGFSQLRQGKIEEAINTFSSGLAAVSKDAFGDIADFENLLGQAKRHSGQWSEALDHYSRGLRAFQRTNNIVGIAGVHVNRSYIYAAQGLYENAKQEAQRALDLLSSVSETNNETERNLVFSQLNMGTAYRHSGNYVGAENWYKTSLETARRIGSSDGRCQALENLGVNSCLLGRKVVHEEKNLLRAAQLQLQAFHYLVDALSIAGGAHWHLALADGLSRLARVYEEIHRLVNLAQGMKKIPLELKIAIQDLEKNAHDFQPAIEIEYEHELLLRGDFSRLNWLERSTRLFELSYLIADESENFHRALDSLMEFARLLLELKQFNIVPIVINRTERIKGYDYQEALFSAVAGITQADLDFELEKYEHALDGYADSYADLAKQTGYASYLLTDRLSSLNVRIRRLPANERINWCDTLEDSWLMQSVSTVRPDMLRLLEDIRFDALTETGRQA